MLRDLVGGLVVRWVAPRAYPGRKITLFRDEWPEVIQEGCRFFVPPPMGLKLYVPCFPIISARRLMHIYIYIYNIIYKYPIPSMSSFLSRILFYWFVSCCQYTGMPQGFDSRCSTQIRRFPSPLTTLRCSGPSSSPKTPEPRSAASPSGGVLGGSWVKPTKLLGVFFFFGGGEVKICW